MQSSLIMYSATSESRRTSAIWIASFLVVVIVFHFCYGLQTLLPSNVSWLMTIMHDWGTHQLGWAFYKNEPWQFPVGDVDGYFYPVGTNVGFTDSIPLFAIFFKLFGPLLPGDFQYFGIWLFLCHLLAAYYTILLFRLFRMNDIITFIAVIFIAANPVLIYRGLHPALCAHWLLIASVYVYFLDPAVVRPRRILLYQLTLLIIAALVNPYICFMVIGFNIATAVKLCFFQKATKKRFFLAYLGATAFSLFLCWYIVGMVSFGKKEDFGVTGGYGLYGLNLNSFYNPFGFSSFLPQRKWVSEHQYEGFMYLGMGIFLLLLILLVYGIIVLIKNRQRIRPSFSFHRTTLVPLFILVVVYTLFAITHVISLDDKVLFRLPAPKFIISIGEVFRASSRFFWPVYYLMLIFIIIAIAKSRLSDYLKLAILGAAVLLQLYDTKLIFTYRKLTYGTYEPPLDLKNWNRMISHFDKIIFYPPFQTNNLASMDYQYFAYLASKAGKKINTGYVPRVDNNAAKAYQDSLIHDLAEGRLDPTALYITTSPGLQYFSFPLQADSGRLHYLDGYYVMFASSKTDTGLLSLSGQLINQYKDRIDSAVSRFGKRIVFTSNDPTKIKQGGIRHYVESYTEEKGHLYISGWAFREGVQNNHSDSIFIALKGENEFYTAPANLQLRPDITAVNKKGDLDNSGYNALVFKTGMGKGNYTLGIAIKDSNGYFAYAPTDKTPMASVEKIPAMSTSEDIAFNAEKLETDGDVIAISGWAYLKGQHASNSRVGLVFRKDDEYYLIWTSPVARPDVTGNSGTSYDLDNSGFATKLLKAALPPGNYQLGILIENNGKQSLVFTGKELGISN
jgi:hypothetical protein